MFELDTHDNWDHDIALCHVTDCTLPAFRQSMKRLSSELANWLYNNPESVIFIYLFIYLNDYTAQDKVPLMREILQDTFGELLYRPSGCQKMSASLKQSDVLNSGKQVVIFSDSRCIDDIVFSRGSFESSHSVQNKGGDFGDNQYVDGRFTRAYECDHPFCNYVLNKDEARNGLLAGVNSISQDQLVEDGKSLYHLWAFDYTDSSLSSYLNQNKSAAIKKSGYYYLELVDKDSLLYPICKVGNSWTVSDTKSTFATAASVCSSLGGVFTAPNYIVEAEDIRDVINNHTDDRFHINFANINGVWK